ncbi:MAG: rhamnulokinase [Janthinobacterium lividum]
MTPTDTRALIAIDLGAESCRVSLLRWLPEGPQSTTVHRFANDAVETGNGLRWEIDKIEAGVLDGLKRCVEMAPEGIRSIAVDGWAVDYVRLDARGQAIENPFCYRDPRNIVSEEHVHETLSANQMRVLTAIGIMRINTLYQLHADRLAGAPDAPWLNLPEYLLHRLGARRVSEYTNATHTQLIDMATGTWCRPIFEKLEFDSAMAAPLVPPGTVIGKLTGELTALPAFTDTQLVAPCCHDTASAIAGIPDAADDWAYISSGTWSLVGTLLNEPINTAPAREANLTNFGGAGGRILFHKNVNGMWLLRGCLDVWRVDGRDWSFDELLPLAEAQATPQYLLDVDDPDLLLPGDMPRRIHDQLVRRGLAGIATGPGNAPAMTALILHSLAARYAEVLQSIAEITGKQLRRLYIVGGGSRNEVLNRLTSKATGLEVIRGAVESSTLGNFAVQMATLESSADADTIAEWARELLPTF